MSLSPNKLKLQPCCF